MFVQLLFATVVRSQSIEGDDVFDSSMLLQQGHIMVNREQDLPISAHAPMSEEGKAARKARKAAREERKAAREERKAARKEKKKDKKDHAGLSKFGDQLLASFVPGTGLTQTLPQSMQEAKVSGEWQEVGGGACHHQFGHRFQRKGIFSPTLMFDNTGHIAGIQFPVNTETFPLYPASNLKGDEGVQPTDLPSDLGDYALTTFYMDPDKVCSSSAEDHIPGKFGDRVWVANAAGNIKTKSGNYEEIPLRLKDGPPVGYAPGGCLAAGTAFKDAPGMGQHWWPMTKTTPCNEAGPMFLLYSRGRLVGMSPLFIGSDNRLPTVNNVRPVELFAGILGPPGDEGFEFARQDMSPYYFPKRDNPKCFQNVNMFDDSLEGGTVTVSSLHVMFSDPKETTCDDEQALNGTFLR